MKEQSIRRHPLYQGEPTLDFGEDLDITELTEEQKCSLFLSKYQELVDPLVKYEKYFNSTAKGIDHIFRDVKLYYKKLVLEGTWTEKKYVTVLDDIFSNRAIFSVVTLDRAGLMFDRGGLSSQRSVRRRK